MKEGERNSPEATRAKIARFQQRQSPSRRGVPTSLGKAGRAPPKSANP